MTMFYQDTLGIFSQDVGATLPGPFFTETEEEARHSIFFIPFK